MTIEARFRDDDPIPTLHVAETISIGSDPRPTGLRLGSACDEEGDAASGDTGPRERAYTLPDTALDQGMASKRGDTRVLVLASLGVLVFGLVVAASILLITGRAKTPEIKGSIPFGVARSIHQKVKDGGPYAYAGNSGDDGFWIALEDGKLIALKIQKPGTKSCNVIWRGSRDRFEDCNGDPIRVDQLARYPTRIPKQGGDKGLLMVDLSRTIPPPAPS